MYKLKDFKLLTQNISNLKGIGSNTKRTDQKIEPADPN